MYRIGRSLTILAQQCVKTPTEDFDQALDNWRMKASKSIISYLHQGEGQSSNQGEAQCDSTTAYLKS